MKSRYIPNVIRDRVKRMFGGRCGYCGEKKDNLCIDHMQPIAEFKGGTNDEKNLMPACFQCNSLKSVFDVEQFRAIIQSQVAKARKYSVNFRFAEKYNQIEIKETPIVFYFEKVNKNE